MDREFDGEARPRPISRWATCPRSRSSTRARTCAATLKRAGETKALVDEFNEISMKFAEPMDDDEMNRLLERQGAAKRHRRRPGLGSGGTLEIAADALRLPPWDADVTKLSGRSGAGWPCAACYCRTRTCCCSTNPPTTSMRNRWAGSSASSLSTQAPWWPSPTIATSLITRLSGSSSSTGAGAFPTKATTPPGWRPRRSA